MDVDTTQITHITSQFPLHLQETPTIGNTYKCCSRCTFVERWKDWLQQRLVLAWRTLRDCLEDRFSPYNDDITLEGTAFSCFISLSCCGGSFSQKAELFYVLEAVRRRKRGDDCQLWFSWRRHKDIVFHGIIRRNVKVLGVWSRENYLL